MRALRIILAAIVVVITLMLIPTFAVYYTSYNNDFITKYFVPYMPYMGMLWITINVILGIIDKKKID